MASSYVPKQRNWRWYTDATPDTSMSALANENTKPTLANNTSIIRLRATIAETGGKADNAVTVTVEYSTDDAAFTAFGAANHWNYANGAGTEGSAVDSQLLSDATTKNEYCESGTNVVAIGASSTNEIDIAIVPTANVTSNTTYYFRIKGDGTAIALDTGETHPQVLTASVTNVTVSAGLCSGAGAVQASAQSGDANVSAGLVPVAGAMFAASVLFDNVFSVGLVSCSGATFSVEVVISGGDVTVLLNLQTGTAQVLSATLSGDANVAVGLLTGSGQAQEPYILTDATITTAMLEGTAVVFTVVVDVGGGKRKAFIIVLPDFVTLPDTMNPPN